MRLIASLLVAALFLEACSAANPPAAAFIPALPSLSLTGSPGTFDDFALASVGTDGGSAVAPLFEIPAIPTNQGQLGLTVWGVKDAGGNVTSVTQAEVLGLNGGAGTVHIFFDSASEPVLFVDDTSGYSIAVSGVTPAQATITLCDPDGTADVSTVLVKANGSFATGAVAAGGSCAVPGLAQRPRALASARPDGSPLTTLSGLPNLAQLITAASYVGGLGFALGAILRFKAHKDNPTQVPVSMPIALVFIAAALLFLPSIFQTSGQTLFDGTSLVGVDGVTPFYDTSPP